MSRNIKRIINELMADDRIQRMHRANVAKRQAARAARRAAMLARRNKHLPMAVVIEAVEGNAEEWKELRVRECINRLGSDWLDRLIDMDASESVILYFLDVNDRIFREHLDEINDYRDEVDGVEVFHDCSFTEWLKKGSHWTDEIIEQQAAEIKNCNPEAAAHIAAAKALAEQAKAMYDAAMNFDNAA